MKESNRNFGRELKGGQVYLRLLKFTAQYWKIFLIAIFSTLLVSAVDSGITWLIAPIIDKGFVAKKMSFIDHLPLLLVLLYLVRSSANLSSSYFVTRVSCSVVRDLRQKLFKQLMILPAKFYDKHSSGYLLSTLIYNVSQVSEASSNVVINFLREGSSLIGMIVVMFILSWRLTLVLIVIVPIVSAIVYFGSKKIRRLAHRVQNSMADVTHVAEEAIECYKVVRLYGGEELEERKFSEVTNSNRRRDLKITLVNSLNSSTIQMFLILPAIFLLSYSAASEGISAGTFASLLTAMFGLLRPVSRLSGMQSIFQKGIAGAASVFDLLDEEVENDSGTLEIKSVEGRIQYQNVSFSYETSSAQILNDIEFEVEPGKTVAIVGRSGGGKTTMVNLLARFYELSDGAIKIDGIDIRDYQLKDLRHHLAFVSQHSTLFNDTIANNIAYGLEGVSRAAIEAAARDANVLEFTEQFPEGLDTWVGENGVLLSGGQKQRVSIARALLKNAPILVLDEATSALDSHSERFIQTALEKLMKQRTTLVIAHRLSTIENADKILVLDSGRIVEQGTHQALLELNGAYADLYRLQFQEG